MRREVSLMLPPTAPPPLTRRCAIVQFEPRHEETIPTMVLAANAAGFRPIVVVSKRGLRRRGDIFAEIPGLEADVLYAGLTDDDLASGEASTAQALARVTADDVEFILMNSFNRQRSVAWARATRGPVLAVVHNIADFLDDPACAATVEEARFSFITLGFHVTAELISRLGKGHMDRVATIEPCVWGLPDPAPRAGWPRRVAIPGAISLRIRDYRGLVETVAGDPKSFAGYRFVLGSGGKDRPLIEDETRRRGLGDLFEYLPLAGDQVPNGAYFASLRDAQVILPLTPSDMDLYMKTKITSAVSASVGFAVPMIMDQWSAACYRAPALTAGFGTRATLDALRNLDEAALATCRTDLIAYRRHAIARNGVELSRLIARALA